MKKIQLNTSKLQFSKEKIVSLQDAQMDQVLGGALWSLICKSHKQTCCPEGKSRVLICQNWTDGANETVNEDGTWEMYAEGDPGGQG